MSNPSRQNRPLPGRQPLGQGRAGAKYNQVPIPDDKRISIYLVGPPLWLCYSFRRAPIAGRLSALSQRKYLIDQTQVGEQSVWIEPEPFVNLAHIISHADIICVLLQGPMIQCQGLIKPAFSNHSLGALVITEKRRRYGPLPSPPLRPRHGAAGPRLLNNVCSHGIGGTLKRTLEGCGPLAVQLDSQSGQPAHLDRYTELLSLELSDSQTR